MNELILQILQNEGIDPNDMVELDDGGEQTAFQVLEAAINGALEEIDG